MLLQSERAADAALLTLLVLRFGENSRLSAPPWFRAARQAESRYAQTSTVPRPGAIRSGTACSFAGYGISVVCLATYKARQSEAYSRQRDGKI